MPEYEDLSSFMAMQNEFFKGQLARRPSSPDQFIFSEFFWPRTLIKCLNLMQSVKCVACVSLHLATILKFAYLKEEVGRLIDACKRCLIFSATWIRLVTCGCSLVEMFLKLKVNIQPHKWNQWLKMKLEMYN